MTTATATKLTLSVNPTVVSRAKEYARRQGVSVSRMVEAYLASVAEPVDPVDLPPLVASLRGILKKADREDYRKHLVRKYL
jgi:hypothetical protein